MTTIERQFTVRKRLEDYVVLDFPRLVSTVLFTKQKRCAHDFLLAMWPRSTFMNWLQAFRLLSRYSIDFSFYSFDGRPSSCLGAHNLSSLLPIGISNLTLPNSCKELEIPFQPGAWNQRPPPILNTPLKLYARLSPCLSLEVSDRLCSTLTFFNETSPPTPHSKLPIAAPHVMLRLQPTSLAVLSDFMPGRIIPARTRSRLSDDFAPLLACRANQ